MKLLKDILKKNSLRVNSYQKIGNIVKVDTSNGKFVIKKTNDNKEIFNYLITRNFNYYPDIIDYDNNYSIYKFINDIEIPNEQKMNDLINLVALLHSKTTYYKELDESEYKKLYEDLTNNIEYLTGYYNDIINIIDTKIYMSPFEYLFARNYSIICNSLKYCKNSIDKWYKIVNNLDKYRVCVIHNNLHLSHFIKNSNDYLISWDKSKIDLPVFDLYKLYNNHGLDFDFSDILKRYENIYPLKDDELLLFYILISMPKKIEFNSKNYEMCKIIGREIERLYKTERLIMSRDNNN